MPVTHGPTKRSHIIAPACARALGNQKSSESKDVTLGGLALGGGLQFNVPQAPFPIIVQLDYTHLFLNQENVQFGTPATVFSSFSVGQDIDLVMARVLVPFAFGKQSAFDVPYKFRPNYQTAPPSSRIIAIDCEFVPLARLNS